LPHLFRRSRIDVLQYRATDKAGRDRHAVIMGNFNQFCRILFQFVDQKLSHLAIAVLVNHKYLVAFFNEVQHSFAEWKRFYAHASTEWPCALRRRSRHLIAVCGLAFRWKALPAGYSSALLEFQQNMPVPETHPLEKYLARWLR